MSDESRQRSNSKVSSYTMITTQELQNMYNKQVLLLLSIGSSMITITTTVVRLLLSIGSSIGETTVASVRLRLRF